MVKRNKSNAYEPKDSFLPHALCSFPFVKWCIFSVSFENCSKRGSTLKVSQVSTGFKVFSGKQKRFTQNNRCVSDGAARIPFPSASFISQPGSSDTPRRFQMQSWQQVLWHMQQAEKICCHLQRGGGGFKRCDSCFRNTSASQHPKHCVCACCSESKVCIMMVISKWAV